MERLTSEASQEERLQQWWDAIIDSEHPGQHITHVIRLNSTMPFITALPAFQVWRRDGRGAGVKQFIQDALGWSYVANATAAYANGAVNTRILIVSSDVLTQPAPTSQRFWYEVCGPFFAATCHEHIIFLTEDQVTMAGLPLLDHDDNAYGEQNGIMRTYYSRDGKPEAREFIRWDDPEVSTDDDERYIMRTLHLARTFGHTVRPAELPDASPS